jgi:protein ImuA
MTVPVEARQVLMSRLRREVARLEGNRPPEDDQALSTGSPELDRLLPEGGLRRGTVIEYLSTAAGGGAGILALGAARSACREGRAFVVIDGQRQFYPLAAATWGLNLAGMRILRPTSQADALWALDQALRCPAVGAVWTRWDRLENRDFRRLQLAAESGRTLALLVRPARHRGQPTWADVQWLVTPAGAVDGEIQSAEFKVQKVGGAKPVAAASPPILPGNALGWAGGRGAGLSRPTWKLRVELVRCRGAVGGKSVVLELDETTGIWGAPSHATHSVPVPAGVAHPAAMRRA